MNFVKINHIINGGIANKECLMLGVYGFDNLGRYLVLNTFEITTGKISSVPRNLFWFPNQDVKLGDTVYLFTGFGKNNKIQNNNNTTAHFYYWGINKTIWNIPIDSAALLSIDNWEYKSKLSGINI